MPTALQTLNAQAREWLLHYEARGARQGRQRNAKRSAKRGAKRRAKRRAGRRAKRKEKRDARRSAKPRAERSMERSTKRSEKRSRRLKHEAENAFTFPCLALYFRFMKYTLYCFSIFTCQIHISTSDLWFDCLVSDVCFLFPEAERR